MPPVHVLDAFGVPATVIPEGKVALNARLLAAMRAPVLAMVKVSVDVPPCAMDVGANALEKPGGGATVKVAPAVLLVPSEEVRAPLVLAAAPTVADVTSTCTVQLAPAPKVPPE